MSQDSTISALPSASALTGAEIIPIDQGSTKSVTANALKTFAQTNVNAIQLEGKTWEAPGTIGSTTPNTGVFTTVGGQLTDQQSSSVINFLQSGSGAVTRTVQSKLQDIVSVKDFGAKGDGVTDDTAALQAAINSFGDTSVLQRAGKLLIPCPIAISSTITIQNKSLVIEGNGWGNTQDTNNPNRSYIKWIGAAGTPMFKVINCEGFGIRDLRFVGKSTSQPTAAINFNQQGGQGQINCWLENVCIGTMSGDTSDDAVQFTNGILFDGAASNNSEFHFKNIIISKCGDGIHVGFSQMIGHSWHQIAIYNCTNGVYMAGNAVGSGWTFIGNSVDINQPQLDDASANCDSYIDVAGYHSEGAGRMAVLKGGTLTLRSGAFQLTSSLNADGKVIDASGHTVSNLRLEELLWSRASLPSTPPFLDFSGQGGVGGGKSIVLDGMKNFLAFMTGGTNGMTVLTGDATDVRYVYFKQKVNTTDGTTPRIAQNIIGGVTSNEEWSLDRFDAAKSVATAIPRTGTSATDTITSADSSFIANRAGTITLTLESASSVPGRELTIRTIQNQTVVSASANVIPLIGGAAGTAILAATAGKWALLKSDGTNWQIMSGN